VGVSEAMEQTDALKEYMDQVYEKSIFDELQGSGDVWVYHLHGHQTVAGSVRINNKYDLVLKTETQERLPITKHMIKFVHPLKSQDESKKRIKIDKKVRKDEQGPILNPRKRNHVKNKTLFPLMQDKVGLQFTTLEGDVVSGIIGEFNRYEITLLGKGGAPIVFLRHAVRDVRDKNDKCYLKTAIEEKRVIVRKKSTV